MGMSQKRVVGGVEVGGERSQISRKVEIARVEDTSFALKFLLRVAQAVRILCDYQTVPRCSKVRFTSDAAEGSETRTNDSRLSFFRYSFSLRP